MYIPIYTLYMYAYIHIYIIISGGREIVQLVRAQGVCDPVDRGMNHGHI